MDVMMRTTARPVRKTKARRQWAFAELVAALPESNLPMELWDGEVIMSPTPSFRHQEIVARFHERLRTWVKKHHLGVTGISPLDMVLAPHRSVQPDVLFISTQRLKIIQVHVMGPADLVVEVLSPGSRRRDRIDKRDLYEQHGVQEYWLIDPEALTVEVLRLQGGEYRLAGRWLVGEKAESRLLKGFSVSLAELFEE